jgi:hypothetical protein
MLRHFPHARFLLTVLGLLAGCSHTSTTEIVEVRSEVTRIEEEAASERVIVLTKGDRLSVAVDAEGAVTIVALILPGKRNAGTYISTSVALLETATHAKNTLADPDTEVTVTVDTNDKLVAVGLAVTRRE